MKITLYHTSKGLPENLNEEESTHKDPVLPFSFWYKMVSILSWNFPAVFLKHDLNFSTACIITFPWARLQNRNRQINHAFLPGSFLVESFYHFIKQSSWQLFHCQGSGNGTLWTRWTVKRGWFRLRGTVFVF